LRQNFVHEGATVSQLLTFSLGIVATLTATAVGALLTFKVTTRVNEASFLRQRRFKLWEQQIERIDKTIDLVLKAAQLSSQIFGDRLRLQKLQSTEDGPSGLYVKVQNTSDAEDIDSSRNETRMATTEPLSRTARLWSIRNRVSEMDALLQETVEEIERLAFVVTDDDSMASIQLERAIAQIESKARGEQEFPIDLAGFLETMVAIRDALPVLRS